MRQREIDFGEFARKFSGKTKVIAAALKSRALTAKFRTQRVVLKSVQRFSRTRANNKLR
jgi:hypothetical protein